MIFLLRIVRWNKIHSLSVSVAGKPEETRVIDEPASRKDDLRMRRVPRWQSGAVSNELREGAARPPAGSSQRRFPDVRPRERLRVQDFQDSPRPIFRRRVELTGSRSGLSRNFRRGTSAGGWSEGPIFTKRVRLKVVDRWPATTSWPERNDATSSRSRSTIARSEHRWVIHGAADRGHSARMRALAGSVASSRCCILSLFVIVRTGRPVPRQEIVKVMYGHVARYVHLERVHLERIFMPLAGRDITRIVRVHLLIPRISRLASTRACTVRESSLSDLFLCFSIGR